MKSVADARRIGTQADAHRLNVGAKAFGQVRQLVRMKLILVASMAFAAYFWLARPDRNVHDDHALAIAGEGFISTRAVVLRRDRCRCPPPPDPAS